MPLNRTLCATCYSQAAKLGFPFPFFLWPLLSISVNYHVKWFITAPCHFRQWPGPFPALQLCNSQLKENMAHKGLVTTSYVKLAAFILEGTTQITYHWGGCAHSPQCGPISSLAFYRARSTSLIKTKMLYSPPASEGIYLSHTKRLFPLFLFSRTLRHRRAAWRCAGMIPPMLLPPSRPLGSARFRCIVCFLRILPPVQRLLEKGTAGYRTG